MRFSTRPLFPVTCLMLLALGAVGCKDFMDGLLNDPNTARLSGTVTYRERLLLPDNAVLEVVLEDVSRADGPSLIIARETYYNPVPPPIPFTLRYNPTDILETNSYNVRATIRVENETTFRTTDAYPVITHGNPTVVDVQVERTR